MPAYMNIDATKHNGTARKTELADFGIERKHSDPTDKQLRAWERRKSEARKQYEEQQRGKRGKA